ncbi:MAG TPA: S41 family peptidase [Chitinophaga sp.]|uniref:S41 family peptidase n=1 Tax=Chitinophaga sp. TaxID=1869181 RepID=UPI002DB66F85|nr:S41 family peptidase [Chitinophaga sp.]HEU4553164.1 S41 family peptidase [Chitinophaga sp.]
MPPFNLLPKVALPVALLMAACSKNPVPPPAPAGPVTQKETNTWILDSMRYFYLWNNTLPATADTQPAAIAYFNRLKYSGDRFSLIYDPNDLATYPKYMLYNYGIDFSIVSWPGAPGGAIGVVKLVLEGSPAAQAGLRRGSYFTRINGTAVNSSNAAILSAALLQGASGTFTLAAVNGNTVTENATITLAAQSLGENPVYRPGVRSINGRKVAYLFYNYFNDGYNQSVKGVFQDFKTAGANELILDLRYNPGGSVAAAALLAALVAPGINEQSGFAKYSGNGNLGQRIISFKSALSVPESGAPIAFGTLEPARLSLSRVFILCSNQTASAAELLINNLKPYTQVILIGQHTFGKDKGAVVISDMRTPKRMSWVLMPISYNLANAKGEGGYTQGIAPQYIVDEFSKQPLADVGDNADPLIAKAIDILNGNGRTTAPINTPAHSIYFDTRRQQAAANVVSMPAALFR